MTNYATDTVSFHYTDDRAERERIIVEVIGEGNPIDEIFVDKGHPKGPERHTLTDTGIIIVHNARTNKLVTKLIARPSQVKRFFKNKTIPSKVMQLAREHQNMGYNEL